MNFLTNKHVVVAMLIAPILALISYFAVDSVVSEKLHLAEDGRAYALVEKPNCRYSSGKCGLKNGNFEVEIMASRINTNQVILELTSTHTLNKVLLAVDQLGQNSEQPSSMQANDPERRIWTIALPQLSQNDRLQLAIAAQDSFYYGDSSTEFIEYHTGFSKDFREPRNN